MKHFNLKLRFKGHSAFFLTTMSLMFSCYTSSVSALDLKLSSTLGEAKSSGSGQLFSGLVANGSRHFKRFAQTAFSPSTYNLPALTSKISLISPQQLVSDFRVSEHGRRIDLILDSKGRLV